MAKDAPDIAAYREWLCSLVDLEGARLVVDLGCGAGHDLTALAGRTGEANTRFLGIDSSEKAISEARDRAEGDSRVRFQCAQLTGRLPLDDASADVVFSNNLLECIGDHPAFLGEVARALKPRGQVVFAHWDWDTQVIDGTDKALVRRLVHAFADWKQAWMDHCDGWMGRRLWKAFQATGFFGGEVRVYTLTNTEYREPYFGFESIQAFGALVRRGMVEEADNLRLLADVEDLAKAGCFFYAISSFAYLGRKRRGLPSC